jgi:lipopolysaccharide/colanic/teichoic acid biosynthesis glycosyltransferase
MIKRLLDVLVAGFALVLTSPLFLVAAIGIRITSPGPIFYRATRIGRDLRRGHPDIGSVARRPERRRQDGYYGREFTMYKFRTMHVSGNSGSSITARNDSRVFPFGAWLRATKIDELPQLFNVIKGDMALVGPRPEAPEIVRGHYTPEDLTTLQIPPGLTSPGSLYYYTHCEATLANDSVVEQYVKRLLPVKLALDRVYIRHATVLYDLRMILRTITLVVARTLGRRWFPDPPELAETDVNAAYPPPIDLLPEMDRCDNVLVDSTTSPPTRGQID